MTLRFVMVRLLTRRDVTKLVPWRATAIKPNGKAIDIWFWAPDKVQAKALVRCKYPDCTFSDETVS